jgi:hypothetical protein
MFHACVQRFDVTENLKKFWKLNMPLIAMDCNSGDGMGMHDPVHPAYNPYFLAYFFQSEQYFSLTTNQPTVF